MNQESLIVGDGIFYQGVLKEVKKSKQHLQPIYEAFTNALESIKLKKDCRDNAFINVTISHRASLNAGETLLHEIVIEDSGIGFDEANFERMTRYKDNRKGFSNNGSGRIQLLHFFDTAKFVSVFRDLDGLKERSFVLSKHYLHKNSIIYAPKLQPTEKTETGTVVTLHGVHDQLDKPIYDNLTASGLKKAMIARYIMEFCTHSDKLPNISISDYLDGKLVENVTISQSDIPSKDQEIEMQVPYYRLTINGKDFEKTGKEESLKLTSFKIGEHDLRKNEIKLTSKGEIVPDAKLDLKSLASHDKVEGTRYLFLISGTYIDENDGDTRGAINIPRREDFKKANASHMNLYNEEHVFLDDIESEANTTITKVYPQILEKKKEKQQDLDKLKKMFLLDESIINSMKINIDDSEEKILERVYVEDSKTMARKDAEIKKSIDKLEELDPCAGDYNNKLNSITSELVKAIPLQNRASLTHYVARRKLVLDLFCKILARELEVQKSGQRNIDEKLLHNLIFQQSSSKPEESDLWVLNEDFIYFKGTSEARLCDVEVDGKKVFKTEFSAKEEEYLLSLGENRKRKRPDVLLFPDEGKCIIIEFKNTEENISNHLNQINKYAFLIRNYSETEFHLETFYGYLIGEKIHPLDVRSCDANFVQSYHFDYLFRPHEPILDVNGIRDGSLYTEVIQYSTLLKRALRRNEIFIQKLLGTRKSKESFIVPETSDNSQPFED